MFLQCFNFWFQLPKGSRAGDSEFFLFHLLWPKVAEGLFEGMCAHGIRRGPLNTSEKGCCIRSLFQLLSPLGWSCFKRSLGIRQENQKTVSEGKSLKGQIKVRGFRNLVDPIRSQARAEFFDRDFPIAAHCEIRTYRSHEVSVLLRFRSLLKCHHLQCSPISIALFSASNLSRNS